MSLINCHDISLTNNSGWERFDNSRKKKKKGFACLIYAQSSMKVSIKFRKEKLLKQFPLSNNRYSKYSRWFSSKPSRSEYNPGKEEIESSINYLYNFRSLSHYRYSTGGGIGRGERRRRGRRRDDGEDDLFTRNVGFSAWTVRLARKSREEEGTIRRKRRKGREGDVSVARKEKTFFGRSRRNLSLLPSPFSPSLHPFSPCSTTESINFSNFWSAAAALYCLLLSTLSPSSL